MKQRENKGKLEQTTLQWQEEPTVYKNGHGGSNPSIVDINEGLCSGKFDWLIEALPASNEIYRRIFETSDQGIWISDPRGKALLVNPKMAEMLGYSRQEMIGEIGLDLLDVGSKEPEVIHGNLRDTTNIEREYKLRRKNGEEIWTLVHASPLFDSDGHYIGNLMMHTDITEHKLLEEALAMARDGLETRVKERTLELRKAYEELNENMEFNRALLEKSANPVLVFDPDTNLKYVSPAFETLTGFTSGEVIGKKLPYPWWPAEMVRRYQDENNAAGEKDLANLERRYLKKNGEPFWVTLCVTHIRDESGKSKYDLANWVDITQRKQVEEALKVSEEKFSKAFSASPVPMIISTLAEGKFVDVNESFLEASGYDQADLIGHPSSAFNFWPDAAVRKQVLKTIKEQGKIRNLEVDFVSKAGKIHRTLYSAEIISLGHEDFLLSAANDITERKKAGEALQESESKYRSLFDTMAQGVVYHNSEGRVTSANPAAERILGLALTEMLNASPPGPYWKAIHEDGSDFPWEAHPAIVSLETGKEIKDVVIGSLNPKETRSRWISLSAVPQFSSGDSVKPCQVFTTITDVTPLKEAEAALKESEAFNSSILNNAPNPIVVSDADTSIRYINSATESLTGYSRAELLGKKIPYPWWPEEDIQQLNERLKFGETAITNLVRRYRKKNGEIFWISLNIKRIESQGKLKYFLSNWVDITEPKRIEEALKESERRYRLLAENASDVFWTVDINSPERINYISPSVTQLLGYSVEEAMSKNFQELFSPDSFEVAMKTYTEEIVLKKSEKKELFGSRTLQLELMRKDGSRVPAEVKYSLVREHDGRPVSILAIARDITGRKRAEENLKESYEKLQKAVQGSIDTAAKMVEMRDPYTAGHQQKVALISTAIAREMNLPEEQMKYVSMAALVHDIGKIYVPAEILNRTGKLTDLEYQMMKTHVQGGYDILKDIEFPWPLAQIVLQHHEKIDGSGYPNGLKGDDILLEARIIAVADAVEAMSTHRPYRPALGVAEALDEISENKGRLYDAAVVDACLKLFKEKGFTI